MGEIVEGNFPKVEVDRSSAHLQTEGRRKFLKTKPGKIATFVAAAAIAGQLGVGAKDGKIQRFAESVSGTTTAIVEPFFKTPEKELKLPNIGIGLVEINKDKRLNVRTEPYIPYASSEPPNTIDWRDIKELNGTDVSNTESFIVENPILVEGQNPSNGYWIKLGEKIYVNLDKTAPYVKKSEGFKLTSATKNEQGQLMADGLKPEQIGEIKIPLQGK